MSGRIRSEINMLKSSLLCNPSAILFFIEFGASYSKSYSFRFVWQLNILLLYYLDSKYIRKYNVPDLYDAVLSNFCCCTHTHTRSCTNSEAYMSASTFSVEVLVS